MPGAPGSCTLGSLTTEIAARMGFNGATSLSAAVTTQIQYFLQDAQEQLYWQYEWEYLRKFWPVNLVIGQNTYDYSTFVDANLDTPSARLMRSVHVVISNLWSPMEEGIDPALYTLTTSAIPTRYARREESSNGASTLEIWPTPSAAYTLQIESIIALRPFAATTDVTTMDCRLVFLFALAAIKAHYGAVDANAIMASAEKLLNRLQSKNHGNMRYRANALDPQYVPPLPLFNGTWQN